MPLEVSQEDTRKSATKTTRTSNSTTKTTNFLNHSHRNETQTILRKDKDNEDEDDTLIELDVKFVLVTMLLSVLWFICISISTANHHVEAFTRSLQSKLLFLRSSSSPPSSADETSSSSPPPSESSSESSSLLQQFMEKTTPSSSSSFSGGGNNSNTSLFHDLSPPFALEGYDHEVDTVPTMKPNVTHFCFLIHGHRGLSKDLLYMQTVMQRWAAVEKKKRNKQQQDNDNPEIPQDSCAKNDNDATTTTTTTTTTDNNDDVYSQDLVIHNAVCNEGKTTDGVKNGGMRLVEEIRQVIAREIKLRYPDDDEEDGKIYDITLSLLGNSLGGLFARYAIAELISNHCLKEEEEAEASSSPSCWILDGKYRLHLNIFCTTATPHLGISRHTYVRIPRTAEIGVAHAMGDTGKDLFRINNLLHTMATTSKFLEPLANFRKRIAYANAYGTDFPVPAGTAAFLSENSTYPHYFFEEEDVMVDESGYIVATVHTPAEKRLRELQFGSADSMETFAEKEEEDEDDDDDDNESEDVEQDNDKEESERLATDKTFLLLNKKKNRGNKAKKEKDRSDVDHEEELHEMSVSLDKLGWKKVFVDIRRAIPSIEVPTLSTMRRQIASSSSRLVANNSNNTDNTVTASNTTDGSNSTTTDADAADTENTTTNATNATTGAAAANPNCIHSLKESNKAVESRHIASAVHYPKDNRLALPLGHNMIVAFSRSRISTYMNKGGRPVVDALGKELVEDIFTWQEDEEEGSSNNDSIGQHNNHNKNNNKNPPTKAMVTETGKR